METPTYNSGNVETDLEAYKIATLGSTSDQIIPRNAQPGHFDKFRRETYKINKNKRVYQPSDVTGLAVIRPVSTLFSNDAYYQS